MSIKKKVTSHIKLPELNKKEKLKTESKNDSLEINKVVGKKLMTEIPQEDLREGGVHKYIKNYEERNRKKINNLFKKNN